MKFNEKISIFSGFCKKLSLKTLESGFIKECGLQRARSFNENLLILFLHRTGAGHKVLKKLCMLGQVSSVLSFVLVVLSILNDPVDTLF